jgi:leucyl aminopeptidase
MTIRRTAPAIEQVLVEAAGVPAALPLYCSGPAGLASLLASLPDATAAFVRDAGFAAKPQDLLLLPGEAGLAGALLGLGDAAPTPASFGALPYALPAGSTWRFAGDPAQQEMAALGWGLGAYRYRQLKAADRAPAMLALPPGCADALATARATWRVRDLINTPANLLGPAELADAVLALGAEHGATSRVIAGEELRNGFPCLNAVGQGSPRAPRVAVLEWGEAGAPLVALCGKGVCFDTGGLDLKPSGAMLRMKKDMGGAAVAIGVAELVMQRRLPVRLMLLVGAVENSVSGDSFRPMDVLRTRAGLTVEVGNTDAEGRLVLADLLTFAGEHKPDLVLDFATLTGAARVALGPDLPALFANDDRLAEIVLQAGAISCEPLWRLPLHPSYNSWLDSNVADLNNVSSKPMAGAIVAALFLQRFVTAGLRWAHVDLYAWNDAIRPGRPEGGEAQAMRAMALAVQSLFEAGLPAVPRAAG